jgi:hypothetical protein
MKIRLYQIVLAVVTTIIIILMVKIKLVVLEFMEPKEYLN